VAFSGGHSVSEGTKDSKHGRLAIELRWGRSAGLGGGMTGTTVAGRPVGELACNNVTATPAVRGPATARARRRRSRKMARFVVVLLQQLADAGPRQLLRPSLPGGLSLEHVQKMPYMVRFVSFMHQFIIIH
jgi:hypothetical protein